MKRHSSFLWQWSSVKQTLNISNSWYNIFQFKLNEKARERFSLEKFKWSSDNLKINYTWRRCKKNVRSLPNEGSRDLVLLVVLVHQRAEHWGSGHGCSPGFQSLNTVVEHLVLGNKALGQSAAVKNKDYFVRINPLPMSAIYR